MQFSKNNEYREYFEKRFGVPHELMERFTFYEHGRSVWAFTGKDIMLRHVETMGIRALRIKNIIKPTTAFIRVIGAHCKRNVVNLKPAQATRFLRGETVEGSFKAEPGFVVVKSGEDILGCGIVSTKGLISQIPKKYRYEESWL